MNDHFYIYTHLGLGDAIICNGLIRNLISKNSKLKYYIFCKEIYKNSISFMYRDVENIKILPLKDDKEVMFYIMKNKIKNLIKVGFENLDITNKRFDQSFYEQFGIDFSKRWDDFKVERDIEREMSFFDRLGLEKGNYVFIHDDEKRRYKIDRKNLINEDLKVITPNDCVSDNIFDWCMVLENAKELHFLDSCFKLLYDSIPGNQKMAFYHTYVRGNTNVNITNSRKKFIIISESPY